LEKEEAERIKLKMRQQRGKEKKKIACLQNSSQNLG
jgi:hypothetical protein